MGKKRVITILKKFKKSLQKKIKIEKIILFGSYANGKNKMESDIDVVVVSDDFKGRIFLKELIS